MIDKISLLKLFEDQNIGYKLFLHSPMFTIENSKKERGKIGGAHTKNLFLKNKKDNFYLFSCHENTSINLKILKKKLNLGSISFANKKYLKDMLNIEPGAVTPFGLLNDINNKIAFYLDKKLFTSKILNFHPLDNAATINISTKEFLKFMNKNMKLVKVVDFDTYTIVNEFEY